MDLLHAYVSENIALHVFLYQSCGLRPHAVLWQDRSQTSLGRVFFCYAFLLLLTSSWSRRLGLNILVLFPTQILEWWGS